METKVIKHKFRNAKNNDSLIFPPDLFKKSKPFIWLKYLSAKKTKMLSKILLRITRYFAITVIGLQLNG